MSSHNIIVALGIPDDYLEKTTLIRSTFPPSSYKSSRDTLPPPISLSLHWKQINKIKNKLDEEQSRFLARMYVSNYKATFSPIYVVFLELDIDQPSLEFKILDENNNEVIPKIFSLQLLNKQCAYMTMKPKVIQSWTLQQHKNHEHIA